MEQRAWIERPDRKMTFRIRRSSRDRFWRGFEATLYDASDGYSDQFFAEHSVSMHVGKPVLVTSRCDSVSMHRLQVPGDIKVIPAGYSRIWEIAAPTRKFVVDLTPWYVREVAEAMDLDPDSVAIAPQLHVEDPQIQHICWALLSELETEEPLGRVYAESLGFALAAQLLRRFAAAVPQRAVGLPKRRLQHVIDYIREHIARDLSLAELSAVAGVSPSHFKVCFKESTGMPVHQFVINARVEHAVDLIVRSTLPLSEVALQAGFSNQSHLSQHVRRMHGLTPAALRREATD